MVTKVDVLYELERKIIEILLLYGTVEEEFEDVLLKANEDGEAVEVKEMNTYKVYQRIYLSLQEDEVELANPLFRAIYNDLINYFHQHETFELEQYLMRLEPNRLRSNTYPNGRRTGITPQLGSATNYCKTKKPDGKSIRFRNNIDFTLVFSR